MPGFDTVWSVTCSPKQMNWQINSCGKVWTRSSPAKVGTQAIKYSAEALWTSSHGSKKTSANVGQTYFFVSYLDCMSYFRKLLFLQPFDQGLDGNQAGRRGDRFAKGGQEPFHFPLEATSIYQVYTTWKGKCQWATYWRWIFQYDYQYVAIICYADRPLSLSLYISNIFQYGQNWFNQASLYSFFPPSKFSRIPQHTLFIIACMFCRSEKKKSRNCNFV